MSIDKDYIYEGLLGYNFFPMVKEKRDDLPPLFSSDSFSPLVADKLILQQNSLDQNTQCRKKHEGFDQIEYRTTRFNNIIRLMHIPHPTPFAYLCKCLRDNWDNISYICDNEVSQIKPQRHDDGRVLTIGEYGGTISGRVVVMEKEHFPDDIINQLDMSFGARYLVEADISSCFPTIYTHAVSWAIVGHDRAKQERNDHTAWFNQLDKNLRNLKRGETQGVPIGPATSNIISEIILSRVDKNLIDRNYRFIRFIDDFKCYCESKEKAEEFLRDLEREVSKYLMSINAKKINIIELPIPAKSDWVTSFSSRLPDTKTLTSRQMVSLLDTAVVMQKGFPEGSIIKYASRVILNKLTEETVDLYVQYLLQVAMHYPTVLPMICEAVKKFTITLALEKLERLLNRQIDYRRSDMACWTIYLIHLTGHSVQSTLIDKIINSGDVMAMAALMATDHSCEKIVDRVEALDGAHYYELDKFWLIIHELILKRLIKNSYILGYAEQSGLKCLKDNRVSFLRTTMEIDEG